MSVAGALLVRCCWPDHRDTYDAMFDLWFPAALGARAVITTEDESVGVCRPMMSRLCGSCCWICCTCRTRPARTSSCIVEAYKQVQFQPRSVVPRRIRRSGRWLDELEGKLLAGLLSTGWAQPPRNRLLESACRADRAAAHRMVDADQAAHSRATRPKHVRCADPQLSGTSSFCVRQVSCARCAGWWLRWRGDPVGRPAAPRPRDRSICAGRRRACPPAACRSTWCFRTPGAPGTRRVDTCRARS